MNAFYAYELKIDGKIYRIDQASGIDEALRRLMRLVRKPLACIRLEYIVISKRLLLHQVAPFSH